MSDTHTISVLVENRPGVLARISGLFARRGFNIDSLAVGETHDPATARITIVLSSEGKPLEQVVKQLHKLINVLRVIDLPEGEAVERELALIKVAAEPAQRAEILGIAEVFRAKVVDVDARSLVIEVTGGPGKVNALEELVRPYGVLELARTGRVALQRGERSLRAPSLQPVPVMQPAS
ncbi:MAG: acetolactate synthase small subunit [Actinomycetota bacterium]